MKDCNVLYAGLVLAALSSGCGGPGPDATTSTDPTGGEYLLSSEPSGAQGVAELRKVAKDGQPIVMVGRIGGEAEPFVKGLAAFTLVDVQLKPCPPEEGCPSPWDYCCDLNKLPENRAMVKVVDAQGRVVESDAKQLLGVKELTRVVVQGTAKRDQAGNLSVMALRVYRTP